MTLTSTVRSNCLVWMVGALAAVGASPACSSDATSTPGAGGAAAGHTSSAGATSAGGATPSAGAPAAGGAGNTAGAGPGGGSTAGGASGGGDTGGAPPIAGAPGCTAQPYTHVSAFGAIFDGWGVTMNSSGQFLKFVDPDTMMVVTPGATTDLDTADGSPDNGSAKLSIPFSMPSQILLFGQNFTSRNLAGATVSAKIKLDSGLLGTATSVATAFLILKTGPGYTYVAGPSINLDPTAGWVSLSIDADAPMATDIPPGYNACDVREIDIAIQSADTGTFKDAVVHIDTIAITAKHPVVGGDAGAGGEAGAN